MAVGGYDYTFINTDLPDEFHCLICTFVPRQPHQVTCCGKIYCKECLDELKKSKQNFTCPNCRKKIANNYFKDINTKRKIRQLKVYCTNKENGCRYKGELKDLEGHLTNCLYQIIKCPNQCDVLTVQRHHLQHHLKEDCPNREVPCPHCHITDKHNIITGTHLEKCPGLLILCPNEGCQEHIKRCEIHIHKRNCLKEVVSCRYASVGCKHRIKREELDEHDRVYIRQHLELAVDALQHLNTSGIVNIKMENFEECKENKQEWYSPAFYSSPGGYKMCLRVNANGYCEASGTYVSCFVCLMSGEYDDTLEWPFQGEVTIELLNQLEDKNHKKKTTSFNKSTPLEASQKVVGKAYDKGWGYPKFIAHSELSLNSSPYLKDDTLYFRVNINVTSKTKPWLARMLETTATTIKHLETEVSSLKSRLNTSGIVTIKMTDFKHYQDNNQEWHSTSFYTSPGGYKMHVCVDANGYGDGKGSHVSCFVCLMPGEYDDTLEWPFQGKVTVELLNQLEDKNHTKSVMNFNELTPLIYKQRVIGKQCGDGWGWQKFISHSELSLDSLLQCQYLKDDTLYFRVSATVVSKTKPWLASV